MSSYAQNLLEWLRDAHAMEQQAEELFAGQAKRLRPYGELSVHLETEARASAEHQKRLSIRIQQLGSDVSTVKNAAAKILALGQNAVGAVMSDEPVKGVLGLYTTTHMGLGAYRVLITAAESMQDQETARLCTEILNEYKARSLWLETNLEEVTRLFLARSAA